MCPAQPLQGARSRDKGVGCSLGFPVLLCWQEQVALMSMGTGPVWLVVGQFLNLAVPFSVFSPGREAGFKVSSFRESSPNRHPLRQVDEKQNAMAGRAAGSHRHGWVRVCVRRGHPPSLPSSLPAPVGEAIIWA